MQKHARVKLVIAIAIAGISIGLVATARSLKLGQSTDVRSKPAVARSGGEVQAVPAVEVPLEHRASTMTFDIDPESLGVDESVRRFKAILEKNSDGVLDSARGEALAATVAERWNLLVAPNYDEWLRAGERYGLVLEKSERAESEDRERWARTTKALAMAPVASEGVLVRRPDPARRYPFIGAPGVFMRAGTASPMFEYPKPPKEIPGVSEIEVVIPLKYSESDTVQHQQPATGIMRLYWDPKGAEWRPYDWMIFMDHSASGKTFPMPIL